MRSALLLSIISLALLGLFGLAKHDRPRSAERSPDAIVEEDESTLFVG
ncbi:MAG: hypothetical protein JSV86_22020 [Gemmatimonadota bacterium]|nr:MAG: hypothetical protein JSV86_22020 [Gemmatimonadota bacterium]